MGIPGLWNELRPYGHRTDLTADLSERVKTLTDLQGKVLAIDLSFWICENVGTYNHPVMGRLSDAVAKPHLRNVFYRTVKLISRVGALPVFVVDGDAPSLKMEVRLRRFHAQHQTQAPNSLGRAQGGGTVRRNSDWEYHVKETVDLLRLMGLPVIYAHAEAEALCAQLNAAGRVDACVSPDSDAFLYGAKTLIKELAVDLNKPVIDQYEGAEIAERLGLKRPHLVALALLLGCDFDTKGVEGCGPKQGIKLVSGFPEDEILDRLRSWAQGERPTDAEMFGNDEAVGQSQSATSSRPIHCGTCGHPGKVVEHRKGGCDGCGTEGGDCTRKGRGFQCRCDWCVQDRAGKERQKQESWWGKICDKIARQPGFPNEDIIDIFMRDEPRSLSHLKGGQARLDQLLTWQPPDLDGLGRFLTAKCEESEAHWQLKALPLTTAHYFTQVMAARLHRGLVSDLGCLRQIANLVAPAGLRPGSGTGSSRVSPDDMLLDSSFKPSRVERIKVDASEALYRIEWRRVAGESAERSEPGTSRAAGGPVSNEADGEDEAEKQGDDGEQGPEEDGAGPEKVVLQWRKASGFVTDERKLMVQLAFPNVAGVFEDGLAAKAREKARKEAEKEARKKERAERAALKQTNIKSFFATKKGGQKPAAQKGGPNFVVNAEGRKPSGNEGRMESATAPEGRGNAAETTGRTVPLFAPSRKDPSTAEEPPGNLWTADEGGKAMRREKRSDMSLRGGDGLLAEDDAGPSDQGHRRITFDAASSGLMGADGKTRGLERRETKRSEIGGRRRPSEVLELDTDVSLDGEIGADAFSDALPGASGRRSSLLDDPHERVTSRRKNRELEAANLSADAPLNGSGRRSSLLGELPKSPFTLHPERRAGFEKLAELQRRIAALSGGVTSAAQDGTSAEGGRASGEIGATSARAERDAEEKRLEAGKEGGLRNESNGAQSGEQELERVQEKVNSSVGLLGTLGMPVEIVDSPPRPARKATRVVEEDSRPTTPVRRSPGKGSRGEGSPVTPSKRRAEDCPEEDTPPKRLADQFDRVRAGERGKGALLEKSSAKRLTFSTEMNAELTARGNVPGAKASQVEAAEGCAAGGGNEGQSDRGAKEKTKRRFSGAGAEVEDPHQLKPTHVTSGDDRTLESDVPPANAHAGLKSVNLTGEDINPRSRSRKEKDAPAMRDLQGQTARVTGATGKRAVEVIDLGSDEDEGEVVGRKGSEPEGGAVSGSRSGATVERTVESAKNGPKIGEIGVRKQRREVLEIRKRRPR